MSLDDRPEISDLIVDYDPETLARRPVLKSAVLDRFRAVGDRQAVRIVRAIPDAGGILEAEAVDRLLVRVHCEIQRLWEEFEHGRRLLEILGPIVRALRAGGVPAPIRVVDVGCGLGYGIRWLADRRELAGQATWIGADYNRALVDEARRLATLEGLDCEFLVANAFRIEEPTHVFLSTGVVHHFRGEALREFFAVQAAAEPKAFLHFDLKPTYLTAIGAWLFHAARTKLPLSLHDGVLSARRSHPGATLLDAARRGAPEYATALVDGGHGWLPITDLFHAVAGFDPSIRDAVLAGFGDASSRFGSFD